jgi:hypothetical protein
VASLIGVLLDRRGYVDVVSVDPVCRGVDASVGDPHGDRGAGLGLLLALVCRWLVALTARSRARAADKRLRDAISEVSAELVVAPIEAELASYAAVREGLAAALR